MPRLAYATQPAGLQAAERGAPPGAHSPPCAQCESSYYTSLLETFADGGAANATGDGGEDPSTPEGGAAASGSAWSEDVGSVIGRDISRTFPTHRLFARAAGRASLQRLLHAYAIHDPAVGYCQGMAFVAGMLLMYLEEHRAFAAFVTLMHGARLRELYLPGMAALQLRLRQLGELLRRRLPRLAAHLEAHDVPPVIYASSWFLTLYAAEFPWSSPDGNAGAPWSFTARLMGAAAQPNNGQAVNANAELERRAAAPKPVAPKKSSGWFDWF